MKGFNPIKNELRKQRRTEKLGENAACARCGITTPEALIMVGHSLLEAHHVVGKAHDCDLTVPLCRNCHAEVTEGARDAGASMRPAGSIWERVVMMLRALGSFFLCLGQHLIQWAGELAEAIEGEKSNETN